MPERTDDSRINAMFCQIEYQKTFGAFVFDNSSKNPYPQDLSSRIHEGVAEGLRSGPG